MKNQRTVSSYFHSAENKNEADASTIRKDAIEKALVAGGNLIETLANLYRAELNELVSTYNKIVSIDADLLREVGASRNVLCDSLKQKIKSLKNLYWTELFKHFDKLTNRLTSKNRKSMLERMTDHVNVDFTESNAYAITVWAIKHANQYFDSQLVETVEDMISFANVANYKSNQRVFQGQDFRYLDDQKKMTHIKLEYRIVLERSGGISNSTWWHERNAWHGLNERGYNYLHDLRTIAYNLGYNLLDSFGVNNRGWESGKSVDIKFLDAKTGEAMVLFNVRAFKNGNMHLKFNQGFMKKLNVEFGRLKGWLCSPEQAAKELDIPADDARESYGSNKHLEKTDIPLLGYVS